MNDLDAPPSSLSAGAVIDGKYRLIGLRGEGAMGSVWHAEHMQLGYGVAIKFLHKAILNLRDSRGRFEREAKIAARLGEESRHVARVLDHGVLDTGMPYVVMELLEGEDLDVTLKRSGKIPLVEISRIIGQLSRALEVAHANGVVHRDLKPANVFLCNEANQDGDESTVKLLDFGVAKATMDSVSFATTTAGALIGTPSYMAPEQISMGIPVDARSDLWALAVLTYRMSTGQMPFGRGTIEELALRIMTADPVAPTSIARELPDSFDVWMRRGLAKKKEDRFQSVRDMATSLADIAREPAPRAAAVLGELVATKKERPVVPIAVADRTLVSPPPSSAMKTQATLISAEIPASGAASSAHRDARKPGSKSTTAIVIVAGLISGGIATYAWVTRSPRASIVSMPVVSSAPLVSASVSAPLVDTATSAAPLAIAPLPSVTASAAISAAAPTHAHATHRTTAPSSTSSASRPAPAASDEWNARNQM